MTNPRQHGFTLMEMLLALALFGLLATLAYSSLRMGTLSWEKSEQHLNGQDAMRIGWRFLDTSLRRAKPVISRSQESTGTHFIGRSNQIEWVAEIPGYLGLGGLYLLRLSVESSNDDALEVVQNLEHSLVLARIPWNQVSDLSADENAKNSDIFALTKPQSAVLIENLAQLDIRYFGPLPTNDATPDDSEETPDVWQAQWVNRDQVPKIIRVNITPQKGPVWPALVIHPLASSLGKLP